ncbi:MAG: PqqD family protein [Eubacteriales bacterium]
MKLKENFITHKTDGEQIMVAAGGSFSGMVRSNATAAFIVDCLKTETTEAEILEKMLAKYDADAKVMAEDIKMIIGKLRKIEAIDE